MGVTVRRRAFIGSVVLAAIWSLPARGEEKLQRRIGILVAPPPNDPVVDRSRHALEEELQKLGLKPGQDIEIHVRGGTADPQEASANARDLLRLKPDLMIVGSTRGVTAVLGETRAVPVVFVNVADPVASGFVPQLARPGGNITGFTNFETTMAGKWVELLQELAPGVQHLLAIYDPDTTPTKVYLETAQTAARAAALQMTTTPVRNDKQVEVAIKSFARLPDRGLIVFPTVYTVSHRQLIIDLASEHRLPAVYGFSLFAKDGGLVSYGPDQIDPFRRAASYVARILKGEKPGDLPVQQPTKFELVINVNAAKTLGLTVPPMLLARADEVIE